jgi:hypothetical protein
MREVDSVLVAGTLFLAAFVLPLLLKPKRGFGLKTKVQ